MVIFYQFSKLTSGRSCYNVLAHEASCSIISFWKIKKFQSKNTAQMRMIKAVPARRTCACVLAC
ncbi:hypothetical protein DERF_001711 [Dermatophagoides farinae]|uniref:Uncharacterized protein n=1 Tax=Dermatophagoides farinae TaxID=6954 RepID=A0A922IFF0_DERFA|nr:hypothetical protein DERF_001711 [Dermatophagoides farinae]